MRILLFVGSLNTGGTERQFSLLADGLARRGHQVTVVTLSPGGQYWDWLAARRSARLHALYPATTRSRAAIAFRLLTAHVKLRRLLKNMKIDVCYSALELTNLIAWLGTRRFKRTTLVWGIRTSDAALTWKSKLPRALCKFVSGSVPVVIANSHAGQVYHTKLGFHPQHWEVIPNGIDTDGFRPDPDSRQAVRAEWGVTEEERLIGLVARLSPLKDHPTFLRAAAQLKKNRVQVRFVCVGDGPKGYRDKLQALTAEFGLDGCVTWTGERVDLPAVYNALDIATLVSSSGEGVPNVVAEAMACEVSCVVTDVGDSRWLVGDCGQVVPPSDAQALARAWQESIDRTRDEAAPGESARSRVERLLGVEALIQRTEDVLSSATSGQG